MDMNRDQSASILYDLAMAMAGETRPHPLATAVLQRLMYHTGCDCGAVLFNPTPSPNEASVSVKVYAAMGDPTLSAMEGQTVEWPAALLADKQEETGASAFLGKAKYRHAIKLDLPELGHVLLFTAAPTQASEYMSLFATILSKFAGSLRNCIDSETNAQALQLSEARFRAMLENTSDWIWEVDATSVYTFSSNKVLDLLGYTPEEVLGRTPFDFMPAQEARHIASTFRDIAESKRPFSGLENTNLHKDGHEVILETSGVPIYDSERRYLGYRGIDRDITTRKRVDASLTKAKKAAEAANHAKSLFLSSMSHELRTPLNVILGHAQLIEMQGGLPEDLTISAHEIIQAGNNLLALMKDVFDLAGIESGNLKMQIEPIALAGVLQECVALNAQAAKLRKVPLNCATDCDHCCVTADRHRLLQVLNQLMSNAVKFNQEGGLVTLSCNSQNGRIKISVTDTGSGIPPTDQAQLFVPFNRLGIEKGPIEGAGVGLAIAQRLTEEMSGSIGLDSTPGQGSTFWIELPACVNDGEVAKYPFALTPVPGPAGLKGARVLVADDHIPNQTVLQIQLTTLGCQVDIADDGAAALRMWLEGRHDLILADLNMPVMDGLALARAVRGHEAGDGRRTPILCITADNRTIEHKHFRDAGMDDVLTKPIALEALQSSLTRWIGYGSTSGKVIQDAVDDAILDLNYLYHVLGDTNLEQGRTLVATFIGSAGTGLKQLTSSTESVGVAHEMHKQKSSARTVGALRYAKLAESLEKLAMSGEAENFTAPLAALRNALGEVETAYANLPDIAKNTTDRPPPLAGHGTLMIVDDDPVVLQQMTVMLKGLGLKEVLTASNGHDALELLSERNGDLEALVCDLNMPTMDGIELIRLIGHTGFRGGLILISGSDEKVLSTVGKLADLQGLRVLGQVQKPVTPKLMVGLLTQTTAARVRKRPNGKSLQATAQSIRNGIAKDQFTVWFQPKVDAVSLRPVGVEALARWHCPNRGIRSPDTFIGVAEREGLIGELSQILTSRALMEGARLHDVGFPLTIAVNLSGVWLDDLLLPDFMLATTHAAGLRPSDIMLEVTETGLMKDLTVALDVLTRLRLKGFGLSIDDFGIGYSSLEQLDRIPFTELKLDRSFVSKGTTDATALAILQGSIDMARKMALSTVAEGVETEVELELVRAMGCDYVQGYLIAKPMPTAELITWLRSSIAKRAGK
ncbi:MAG: EAL domain-containing protein [Thiobacillus sp.]|nr:EAL domain-containing protein [Thiobacillus sp.]